MSYDIFYRHQFISLPDGTFIPYIECGSNNCYQTFWDSRGRQREKRERSWWNLKYPFEKLAMTPQEMLSKIDDEIHNQILRGVKNNPDDNETPDSIRKRYGYFVGLSIQGRSTRGTTASAYRNFFVQGIVHAKPLEELGGYAHVGINPVWHSDMKEAGVEILPGIDCKSGEDLIRAIQVFQEKYGLSYWGIEISKHWVERAVENRPKQLKQRKDRKRVDSFFAIKMPVGFLVSKTKYGYRYTPYEDGGKKFEKKSAAERYVKTFSLLSSPQVVQVNKPAFI